MATPNQNATVHQGENLTMIIGMTNVDDLTGADLHYRIAKRSRAPAAILEVDEPDLSIDGPNVTVPLTWEDTLALALGVWYHELYMIEANVRTVLMSGALTVMAAQIANHDAGS